MVQCLSCHERKLRCILCRIFYKPTFLLAWPLNFLLEKWGFKILHHPTSSKSYSCPSDQTVNGLFSVYSSSGNWMVPMRRWNWMVSSRWHFFVANYSTLCSYYSSTPSYITYFLTTPLSYPPPIPPALLLVQSFIYYLLSHHSSVLPSSHSSCFTTLQSFIYYLLSHHSSVLPSSHSSCSPPVTTQYNSR